MVERLVIELAFLRRIVSLRDTPRLELRPHLALSAVQTSWNDERHERPRDLYWMTGCACQK